ncbi:MAG TPA: sugar phosphate nucleotidyltransferase, partial [Paludibacteraceae bacterium]|nr:sugar phosphate nucleotidyltransferase [Paludibacteraceae bacterium]
MKALILAAGQGTRLKPLTNSIPKALITINGRTLLEYQILKLKNYGFDEIIINVHHFPDQIIDFLKSKNNFGLNIKISDERDFLLDTGGGIRQTEWFFNDGKPFLVHNVDIFSNIDLGQLYQQHLSLNGLATLVV